MRIAFPQTLTPKRTVDSTLHMPREKTLRWIALGAIILLAAVLRFANLEAIGYGNTYYTAAVKSMLQSWHNFFFVAAEPGGSVSVDKPPLGFWLQAISAYFLGVSGFSVVLPEILSGLLSVVVLYHLVQRKFGSAAGLLSALALAITPIVIATDRNNTIDSSLILTLLLAAWAFIKATESGKLRYLLLGAALVGIGFNIKMLQAYLPLPAFYALYFLGSSERFWRKVGKLGLASVLLVIISFSWAVAVDLTPASQRPYVGSSGDNSEMSLIFGYNGIERLLGMLGRGGSIRVGSSSSSGIQQPPAGIDGMPQAPAGAAGGFPGQAGSFSQDRPPGNDGGIPPQGGPDGGRGQFSDQGSPAGPVGGAGGFMGTGTAGPLRLFTSPLSKEGSWLLPFGILSALLLAFWGFKGKFRLHLPVALEHQALILLGGWLLTGGVFFSIAGFFHQYYLSMLAAPLAALVGIGAAGLWQLHQRRPWLAFSLLLAGASATLGFQIFTAKAFTNNIWWLPLALALFAAGALLMLVVTLRRMPSLTRIGFTLTLAAMLLTPGIWSGLTTLSSTNQTIPSSYSGGSVSASFGFSDHNGLQVNQVLLSYLEQNTQGMKYLMAVPSSQSGDGYILASGRPVLLMGGFNGQDQVATGTGLAKLVAEGQLRYVLLGGGGGPNNQSSSVSSWVTSSCSAVSRLTASSGSLTGGPGGFDQGGGTLYDCRS